MSDSRTELSNFLQIIYIQKNVIVKHILKINIYNLKDKGDEKQEYSNHVQSDVNIDVQTES